MGWMLPMFAAAGGVFCYCAFIDAVGQLSNLYKRRHPARYYGRHQ